MSKPSEMPRFQKERYLKSFTEDDFRDKVVRPLFNRLGFERGDDLCGPDERGKDAIFSETDKLGIEIFTAVQTKKGNLNLASKATHNVTNAIAQLRTALTTRISLPCEKKKITPSQVFLVASGKINQTARDHIVEELSNEPRVRLYDSDNLIPLIDENYPELWAGINADIVPYFRALKKMIEGTGSDDNSTDSSVDALRAAASGKSYVTLNLFRTKSKITRKNGEVKKLPDFEETTFEKAVKSKHKKILVVGDAGSGKSTALLRATYEIAKEGVNSKNTYSIPVYLRATDFSRSGNGDLLQYSYEITSELVSGARDTSCFTYDDLEKGRVFFFIDGLDEVASNDRRNEITAAVERLLARYPNVKIIVTSRPSASLKNIYAITTYVRYDISPISIVQAEKMLVGARQGESAKGNESKELLRRIEAVHGIELNPLLVAVFAATAKYSRQDIPANITELFKKYTELLLGRWDESKGLGQQYQAPLKDFILQKIALKMRSDESISISKLEFEDIIKEELENRGHRVDYEIIIEELYRSDLFRIFDRRIEFRHLLLQEFFAGRAIPTLEFIKHRISDDWWRRAIVFFFGEKPDSVSDLEEISNSLSFERGSNTEVLNRSTTIGLALQACYLSQVSQKLSVWKRVAESLGAISHAPENGDAKYPVTNFAFNFLLSRDAVALSDIGEAKEELLRWAKSSGDLLDHKDAIVFWLVTGLMETGSFEEARRIIKDKGVKNPRYLLGIHMTCHLAIEVRYLDRKQKEAARDIRNDVQEKVQGEVKKLLDEFGSQLLELRKGNVEALG